METFHIYTNKAEKPTLMECCVALRARCDVGERMNRHAQSRVLASISFSSRIDGWHLKTLSHFASH